MLDWIQANLGWTITAAFLFAFLESLTIIGIFIPGIVLLFAIGALVGMDPTALALVWIAASAGALAADGLGYWLGSRYRDRITRIWPLSRHGHLLARGETFFRDHGAKSVFIGRFIGPLRPVVPLVAGTLQMRMGSFYLIAVPACLLWAPVYLLPGVLFGASLEIAAEFAGRLALVIFILVMGIWFILWLTRLVYELTARRSAWWLKAFVQWTRRHPLIGRVAGPLFEPGGRTEVLSAAFLGLFLTLSLAALMAVLVLAPLATPAWDAERQVATFAASMRSHFADPVFVVISLAGDIRVLALVSAILALVLIVARRTNAAWHWLAATAGAWILAEILNGFMGLILDRPEALRSLGEVPHRGFTLATAAFGFFAVMVAKDLTARRRKWPYLLSVLLLSLMAFAHFYLGRASMTGLLAALALGTGWLALVGIGYRQRAQARRRPVGLLAGFYGLFFFIAGWHAGEHFKTTMEFSRLAQPTRYIAAEDWPVAGWRVLPDRRSRFGAENFQRFDLQLAGDLDHIRSALEDAGWESLPPATVAGVAGILSSRPAERDLPHLSRDFAGRPENLALRLPLAGDRVFMFRLWSSGARLEPGLEPVWLAQVRLLEQRRLYGGITLWREAAGTRGDAIGILRRALSGWRWMQPAPDSPLLVSGPGIDERESVDESG